MVDDAELQRIRERMHKIADDVQEHRMKIGECLIRISQNEKAVTDLRESMATSEQLENAVNLMTVKMSSLQQSIDPIRRGVNAVVMLIVTTLVGAILALLIYGPKSLP